MDKFSNFLKYKLYEDIIPTATTTPTAPAPAATPVSTTPKPPPDLKFMDDIKNRVEALKKSITDKNMTGQLDVLTLKVSNFRVSQIINILTKDDNTITAKIVKGEQKKQRWFQLIRSTSTEIQSLLTEESNQQYLLDASERPIKKEGKIIYFVSSTNKKNNKLTDLYFYDSKNTKKGGELLIINIDIKEVKTTV